MTIAVFNIIIILIITMMMTVIGKHIIVVDIDNLISIMFVIVVVFWALLFGVYFNRVTVPSAQSCSVAIAKHDNNVFKMVPLVKEKKH